MHVDTQVASLARECTVPSVGAGHSDGMRTGRILYMVGDPDLKNKLKLFIRA